MEQQRKQKLAANFSAERDENRQDAFGGLVQSPCCFGYERLKSPGVKPRPRNSLGQPEESDETADHVLDDDV